jgi:hypothetical protein
MIIDDYTFSYLIKRVLGSGVSVNELAETLGVSGYTVQWWAGGRSLPHPAMRQGIREAIDSIYG